MKTVQNQHVQFGTGATPLHFVAANGYPPAAYTQLFMALPEYQIHSMLLRPLWNPSPPLTLSSWFTFAEDLYDYCNKVSAPIIGVGHSIGATLWLMAAIRYKIPLKGIVLIDPALFSRSVYMTYRILKWVKLHRVLHPLIQKTLKRQQVFASYEAAYVAYRTKSVFKQMSDASLRDYINAIFVSREQGLSLIYDPRWEALIYETGILDDGYIWRHLPDISCPIALIRGEQSNICTLSVAKRFQQHSQQFQLITIPNAGHLVPLECPQQVAQSIQDMIAQW